jgi:hypothetical protein
LGCKPGLYLEQLVKQYFQVGLAVALCPGRLLLRLFMQALLRRLFTQAQDE